MTALLPRSFSRAATLLLAFCITCLFHESQAISEAACHSNADCNGLTICSAGECKLKPLGQRFGGEDIATALFTFIGGAVASSGGVGGGGLYVPTFVILMQVSTAIAIPLSKATIFGGAVANLLQYYKQRHPKADRPVIDYWLAVVMEPCILGGTVIGVLFFLILPSWLISVMLAIILGFVTHKTLTKGMAEHKNEKKASEAAAKKPIELEEKGEMHEEGSSSLISNDELALSNALELEGDKKNIDEDDLKILQKGAEMEATPSRMSNVAEIESILREEKKAPWQANALLIVAWIILFILAFLRGGGESSNSPVKKCSGGWWILTLLIFPMMAYITYDGLRRLRIVNDIKEKHGYEFQKGDTRWNKRNSMMIPIYCLGAGTAAGLLGIGGGMVTSPLMLELGVLPQVTVATSAFMILFTSSSTSLQFAILGRIPLDYGIFYMLLGFASSYVGQTIIGYYVKKSGKASIIIFIVGAVLALSTLLLVVQGIMSTVSEYHKYGTSVLGFKGVC